jgi:hypothetical protein
MQTISLPARQYTKSRAPSQNARMLPIVASPLYYLNLSETCHVTQANFFYYRNCTGGN